MSVGDGGDHDNGGLFNDAPRVALRSVQSVSQLLVLDGFREVHRVGSFRSINGASYDGVPEMMLPGLLYMRSSASNDQNASAILMQWASSASAGYAWSEASNERELYS